MSIDKVSVQPAQCLVIGKHDSVTMIIVNTSPILWSWLLCFIFHFVMGSVLCLPAGPLRCNVGSAERKRGSHTCAPSTHEIIFNEEHLLSHCFPPPAAQVFLQLFRQTNLLQVGICSQNESRRHLLMVGGTACMEDALGCCGNLIIFRLNSTGIFAWTKDMGEDGVFGGCR